MPQIHPRHGIRSTERAKRGGGRHRITLAEELGVYGTRHMLEEILLDEEDHADRFTHYLAR